MKDNIKIGEESPSSILFSDITKVYKNQNISFGSIIPKNNSYGAISSLTTSVWQINDGWEIDIIDNKTIAIKKFKIDTWGLRQMVKYDGHPSYYNGMKVNVTGISYVHKNIVCHTSGSTTPDGFTKAYGGTGGYNVYWYPGQFTSGYSLQGLVIQFGIGYTDNDNAKDDGFQIGRHPWDVGNKVCISDGVTAGTWADNSYRAITIGLYGGVQNASKWHDETGEAYKIYDISDHPIYVNLDVEDTSKEDPSSVECWKTYVGDTLVYQKDRTLGNCWRKYGYLKKEGTYKIGEKTLPQYVITPPTGTSILTPLDDYSCLANCKLNYITPSNTKVWDDIRAWYATNPINSIVSCQNIVNGGSLGVSGMMIGCTGFTELTINLEGQQYYYGEDNWSGTDIVDFTINCDHLISSPQRWFRNMKKLKNIKFNTSSGVDFLCGATSVVDMFGNCNSLEEYPAKLIAWEHNRNYINEVSSRVTLTQYFCNWCEKLKKIPKYKETEEYIACCNLDYMFYQCKALTTIEPILDVSEYTCRPSNANNWFVGCNNLTSVKIKGLNHGDWYFDGTTVNGITHGNLSKLNEESIKYLFDNLADLTTYDTTLSSKAWYNYLNSWTLSNGAEWGDYDGNQCVILPIKESGEPYRGKLIEILNAEPAPVGCGLILTAPTEGGYVYQASDGENSYDLVESREGNNIIVEIPSDVTSVSVEAHNCKYGSIATIETLKKWDSKVPIVRTATLKCPSTWGSTVSFDFTRMNAVDTNITITKEKVVIVNRRPTSDDIANAYINNCPILLKIKVEGLTEEDILGVGDGAFSIIQNKVTQDGEYELTVPSTWGFKLWNDTSTSSTSPVTITPLRVSAIVTSEMIAAANTKGWTIAGLE